MMAPVERYADLLDLLCAECEKHRWVGVGLFVFAMLVGFVGIPAGYAELFAMSAGTLAGSIAGVGFVSQWRGW